jgi:L-asparaginase II
MTGVMVAEVTRNGFVECVHHGSVVVLSPTGEELLTAGQPHSPNFGRSANKMMQTVAMLRHGLPASSQQLALATASHSGGPEHLQVVLSLLHAHGLTESDLQNTAFAPLGVQEKADFLRSGDTVRALTGDCSGKHAAMLATCIASLWNTSNYLELGHPLQQAITSTIEELTGQSVFGVGVDGCGAPAHVVTLKGLAASLGQMARADADSHEGRVAHAIRRHPILVGGRGRDVTQFLLAAPGWIGKDGADGTMVLASPNGFAVAVKIDDGAAKPRIPVALAALEAVGVELPPLPAAVRRPPVLGGGVQVGELRPILNGQPRNP